MAQVKKLKQGSVIKAKEGTLTIGNKSLEGDIAIQRILDAANTTDQTERVFFSGAANAIRDGMDVVYDPIDYKMDIYNDKNDNVSDKYLNTKVKTTDSTTKKIWDASVKNQRNSDRRSAVAFAKVNMDQASPSTDSKLSDLGRGKNEWFVYEKDDKGELIKDEAGNLKYVSDSPTNLKLRDIIENVHRYVTEEDFRKQYSKQDWLDSIYNAYNSPNLTDEQRSHFWENLSSRINSGTLTDSDKEWLAMMGIVEPKTGEGTGSSGKGNGSKYIPPKGWKGDVSFLGPDNDLNVYIGDDGKMHIESSKYAGNWYLGGIKAFENTPYAFKIGDILYTGEEAERAGGPVGEILAPWYAASGYEDFGERYNARKESGIRFKNDDLDADKYPYGRMLRYDENTYNPIWDSYFASTKGPDYYSMYDLGTNKYQAIALPGEVNPLTGWENLRYVVYNPENGKYTSYNSVGDMTSALGIAVPERQRIFTPTHSDALDLDGQRYFTALELNSDLTGNNTIFYNKADGNFYLARKSSKGLESPAKIKDQTLARDIVLNPEKYQALKAYNNNQLWKYLVGGDWYDRWGKYFGWLAPTADVAYRATRKHQWGGIIDSQGLVNNISTAEAQADLSNSHEMFSKAGITGAEGKQIAAAALDLAGVVGAFVPELYTNIAAAGTGVAASIMRSDAEKERTGRRNRGRLATDLALDTVSLVPVLGGFTKTAKAIDGILQVGEPIIKLLTAYGALNGADAMRRAMSTGKLTTDDATSILQGLASAGVGVKTWQRSIGKSKAAAEGSNASMASKSKEYTEAKDLVIDKKATGVKKSAKDIDALISKYDGNSTKVIKEVKEELSNAGVKDVTDSAIKEGLQKINNFKTEGARFRKSHPFETWKKDNRYEIWKHNSSEAPSTHSTWHYELNSLIPFYGVRHRANAIRNSLGNYTAQDIRSAINRFNSGERLTLAERELLNQTVMNPELFEKVRFSDQIGRSEGWKRHWSNMGVFYREKPRAKAPKTKGAARKVGESPKEGIGEAIAYTPTGVDLRTGETFNYRPFNPTMILSDKKGGKIVKAQPGSNTRWWLDPSRENSFGIGSGEFQNNTGSGTAKYSASKPGFLGRVFNLGTIAAILGGPNSIFGLLHNKLYKQDNNSTNTDADTAKPAVASSVTTKSTPGNNGTKNTPASSGSPMATSAATNVAQPVDSPKEPDAASANISENATVNVPTNTIGTTDSLFTINPKLNSLLNKQYTLPFDNKFPSVAEIAAGNPDLSKAVKIPTAEETAIDRILNGSGNPMLDRYTNGINTPFGKRYFNAETGKFDSTSPVGIRESNVNFNGFGSLKQRESKGIGGFGLPGYTLDPSVAIDAFRANVTASDIYKDRRINRDAIDILAGKQFYAPTYEKLRYNFSDINHGENMAKQPYLQKDFVTPDLKEQMAFDLSKASALSTIEDKYNATRSQAKANVDASNINTENKQRDVDAELATTRSNYYTGLGYQKKGLDSKTLNAIHSKVFDPYTAQLSQEFKDIRDMRRQLAYQNSVNNLGEEYDFRIEALPEIVELRDAYNESDEKKNGVSFKSYIASDINRKEKFDKAVKSTNTWRDNTLANLQLSYWKYPWLFNRELENNQWQSSIYSNKKGGKISKTDKGNMDPLAHIAVNLSRDSVKATQKERDNWHKRLMYLLTL